MHFVNFRHRFSKREPRGFRSKKPISAYILLFSEMLSGGNIHLPSYLKRTYGKQRRHHTPTRTSHFLIVSTSEYGRYFGSGVNQQREFITRNLFSGISFNRGLG